MVEAINAMPTQRSVARVWNIHVVFEPPTPPASRQAQRPHGRCFTLEAPSGSSAVVAGAALQTGEPATEPQLHGKEPTSLVDRMLEPEMLRRAILLNIKNPASHSAADQHISDQHILLLSPASGSGPRVARRARGYTSR